MNCLKKTMMGFAAAVLAIASVSCSQQEVSRIIKTDIPVRPAGQEDVLGLRTPALDTVRIAFVGLGGRGSFAVYRYTSVPWTKIVALCDIEPDRVQKNVDFLAEKGIEVSAVYTGDEGFKEMCQRDDIDLVYICTDWKNHTPVRFTPSNTASMRRLKSRRPPRSRNAGLWLMRLRRTEDIA